MKYSFYIFLFLTVCTDFLSARPTNFYLKGIDFPEHFDHQIIKTIEQDQSGLLWLLTHSGLYRYDGNEIIQFRHPDHSSSWSNSLSTVFADREDKLWIGGRKTLTCLELKTWKITDINIPEVEGLASPLEITVIDQDDDGYIYIAMRDGRIFRLIDGQPELVLNLRTISSFTDYTDRLITFMDHTLPGEIWIGTQFGKLVRIKRDGDVFSAPEFYSLNEEANGPIEKVVFDSSGKCLVPITDEGLYILDITSAKWEKFTGSYKGIPWNGQLYIQPLPDHKAIIFSNQVDIGTDKFFIYDFLDESFSYHSLRFPKSIRDNRYAWVKISGQRIFLSMNNKIEELVFSSAIFDSFLADPNSLNSIRCLYKSPGGPLYLGSYKYGFLKYDEREGSIDLLERKYIYTFLPWNQDTILLGSEGNGLMWFETKTDRVIPIFPQMPEDKNHPRVSHVTMLTRLKNGTVLTGSYDGLYIYDPKSNTMSSVGGERLATAKINDCIEIDSLMLIATDLGLYRWNQYTGIASDFPEKGFSGGSSSPVYSVISADGLIWAATEGRGIIITDREGMVIDSLQQNDGLAADLVFSLLKYDRWIIAGTYNGLSIIDRGERTIRNFSRRDQLPTNEFNRSAAFLNEDTAYLGTINGIVRFNIKNLDDVIKEDLSVPVYITDLKVGSRDSQIKHDYTLAYRSDPELTIYPATPYFSISFGGPSANTEELEYFYRLRETDSWKSIGRKNEITFVGMEPGNYNLELSARMPDGQFTRTLLQVPLMVLPAFHQTIWFILLLLLSVGFIIWGIFLYREKEAEKQRMVRLKIAGDLHDDVGSSLAGMSMLADLLLHEKVSNREEYLRNIASSGRQAMNTMSDIVWSIDPRNDDQQNLIRRMEIYAGGILKPAGINLNFRVEGGHDKKEPLSQKKRQNIMLIYKEALTNICKHSQADRVDISFFNNGTSSKIEISDNGIGFPENTKGGHGLRNMRMRAEDIKAKLTFPAISEGVKIVLEFKV